MLATAVPKIFPKNLPEIDPEIFEMFTPARCYAGHSSPQNLPEKPPHNQSQKSSQNKSKNLSNVPSQKTKQAEDKGKKNLRT